MYSDSVYAIFITTAAISIPSTPVCLPQGTSPIRQSRCVVVTPMTFPMISDSARWCTNSQVN